MINLEDLLNGNFDSLEDLLIELEKNGMLEGGLEDE